MLSLEVLHVEIAQKLEILEISLIFEKYSEKGPNKLELMSAFRKT